MSLKAAWSCRCGHVARSAIGEARHRHNFPLLCKHPTPLNQRTPVTTGMVALLARVAAHPHAGVHKMEMRAAELNQARALWRRGYLVLRASEQIYYATDTGLEALGDE